MQEEEKDRIPLCIIVEREDVCGSVSITHRVTFSGLNRGNTVLALAELVERAINALPRITKIED